MTLVFASNNEHKIREIRSILGSSFQLLSLSDINLDQDIPENEPLIEGNALAKARHIHEATGMNVFADDTGLEIDELNGLPGVHSARFAGERKNSSDNILKVLFMLGSTSNRKARFRTVIALILDNKEYLFEGIVNGTITSEIRGKEGFGYDPILFLTERTRPLQRWSFQRRIQFHTGQEPLKNLPAFSNIIQRRSLRKTCNNYTFGSISE